MHVCTHICVCVCTCVHVCVSLKLMSEVSLACPASYSLRQALSLELRACPYGSLVSLLAFRLSSLCAELWNYSRQLLCLPSICMVSGDPNSSPLACVVSGHSWDRFPSLHFTSKKKWAPTQVKTKNKNHKKQNRERSVLPPRSPSPGDSIITVSFRYLVYHHLHFKHMKPAFPNEKLHIT